MEKLLFGTAGIPEKTKNRTYPEGIKDIVGLHLDCLEMEFVHGVKMNSNSIPIVNEAAKSSNVILTAHGPYYINLASPEEEKVEASVKRILDTARVAFACGGYSITFHAAFYMGRSKEVLYKQVHSKLAEITETLKAENINIWIRPELTGKATQWGDLDELISISNDFEMVLPCIDFAHLHARTNGKFNTYDEFCHILERIGNEIGDYALKNFHAHVAGIEYSAKGEKKHLLLDDSDLQYKELLKALKAFDVRGVVICESPNLEGDAILLKNTYESL